MLSFDNTPGIGDYVSASAFGYGNNLANWSNHITKLTARYNLTDQWSMDGSMRIYWGFPGQQDYAEYIKYERWTPGWFNGWCYDDTYNGLMQPSIFLNLGVQFKPTKDLTVRVDGYNLLGIFDINLNKRLIGYDPLSPGDARAHAPALGVSLSYKF
jgi:long-subunit fatty acid transport protein